MNGVYKAWIYNNGRFKLRILESEVYKGYYRIAFRGSTLEFKELNRGVICEEDLKDLLNSSLAHAKHNLPEYIVLDSTSKILYFNSRENGSDFVRALISKIPYAEIEN